MKRIISIFILFAVTVSLSSCMPINSPGKQENKTEIVTKPQSNDVANIINVSMYDFDTFNPLTSASVSVRDAMKFVYEPLFTLDEQLNPVPVLADSYIVSEDGKTLDVKLREDVLWHDGSEFTASDVSYTIKNILGGTTTYSEAASDIESCSVIDNYSIRINFVRSMTNPAATLTFPVIKSGTPMNDAGEYKPIGTGAFSFNGKISVDRYMLIASDYYYKGKAKLGGVYIDSVPDNRRYFTMFNSGNNDVCNSELIREYEYTPKANVNVNDFVSSELIYIGINHASSTLADKNVRNAISAFIDRTAIEENVMFSSVKAVDTFINPMSPYYYGSKNEMRTDSVQGAEFLREAGWERQDTGYSATVSGRTKTLSLRLLVNEDNESDVKIAENIESSLVGNGIDIQLQAVSEEIYHQRIASKDYDLYIGKEDMNLAQDLSGFLGSANNEFGYSNITVDVITGEIATETETEALKELYVQLNDVLRADMPLIPLAYEKSGIYMSARIENVCPVGIDGFYRDLQNWSIK